jgi:hypothetical protein
LHHTQQFRLQSCHARFIPRRLGELGKDLLGIVLLTVEATVDSWSLETSVL